MPRLETTRAVAALILAAALYCTAALLLLHAAIRRVRRRAGDGRVAPGPGWFRWFRRAVWALAGLGLISALYARFVEPVWPQVVHVRLTSPKLPPGARPIRIALIADTHSEPFARLEPRLPDIIRELGPDLVVFAGDALNYPEGLPHFKECMRRIAGTAPTFAVRGNWDIWYWNHLDLFGGTGVRELDGEAVSVKVGDTEIWVAGAAVENERAIGPALAGIPPEGYAVLVHHYPEVAAKAARLGGDLFLAADTHGGQIRMPLIGPLVKFSRFGGYYDIGLHRVGEADLYVNRGIGMEGGRTARVRFLCRPEITIIAVAPEK